MHNKVLICVPHNYPFIEKEFFVSLMRMQRMFYEWVIEERREDELSLILQGGYNLDKMRNDLVHIAIENKQTHLLFIDSDQVFPRNTIVRLIKGFEAQPKADAITAIVHRKDEPYLPCIYTGPKKNGKFGSVSSWNTNSYLNIGACGMGCVMIKADVFKRLKYPYFKFPSLDKKDEILGEDLYFWHKVSKLKPRPMLIADPSLKVAHHQHNWIDTDTYVNYNRLRITKNGFSATDKQQRRIKEIQENKEKNSIKIG